MDDSIDTVIEKTRAEIAKNCNVALDSNDPVMMIPVILRVVAQDLKQQQVDMLEGFQRNLEVTFNKLEDSEGARWNKAMRDVVMNTERMAAIHRESSDRSLKLLVEKYIKGTVDAFLQQVASNKPTGITSKEKQLNSGLAFVKTISLINLLVLLVTLFLIFHEKF